MRLGNKIQPWRGCTLYSPRSERKGHISDERKTLHVVAINDPALASLSLSSLFAFQRQSPALRDP